MNHIQWLIIFSVAALFVSCDKETDNEPALAPPTVPGPVTGTVYFEFENVVDGQPIVMDQLGFTNEAGNVYSIEMLKYYISNLTFSKTDSLEVLAPNYELINEQHDTSHRFAVQLPYGDYDSISFFMGIDSIKNVSGAQAGELDPAYGMFWDWNTGYVYFKHEGQFIDAAGDTLPIVYHFGSFDALTVHSFYANFTVSAQPKTIKIRFNLNKLYRSPNVIDFTNNNIHSGGTNWVNTLKANFNGAFELVSID